MHCLQVIADPGCSILTFYFEVVTLTWKFHIADWFRGWRCNLVMNTEKVKAASLKQSRSVGEHAV